MWPHGCIVTEVRSSLHIEHSSFGNDFTGVCAETKMEHIPQRNSIVTLHSGHFLAVLACDAHIIAWPQGSNLTSTGLSHNRH